MARITFDHGINETESTLDTEALTGCNFNLEQGAKRLFPRKPIDLKGSTPNGGSVNGIMQLVKRDDTETTLIYGGGSVTTPTLYSWTGNNTSTAFTSERTTNINSASMMRAVYWSLDDHLTITDLRKLTPLLNWNGTDATRHKTGLSEGSPAAVTLSCSTGTVTASAVGHGLSVGDLATIAGADQADFNGEHEVLTVPTTTAFTYAITTCPTTTATGSSITFDTGIDLYAKYSVVHNDRLWLFNIDTVQGAVRTENPHMILVSAFDNPESFDTVNRSGTATGNAAFFQLTPDLKPINGVAQFNKQLIVSTVDGMLFRLIGLDASDYQFVQYFAGSAALGEESMANIGNDVAYLRKGGNIDLLTTTDTSGDVRADDLSRWIPTSTKDLTSAMTVYDQFNQKVFFILDDRILVFFKDILEGGGGSPWSSYKTQLTDSNGDFIFKTKAATYIRRPGLTTQTIYLGDADGNIYDMDGSGTGDNGSDIIVQRKSKLLEVDKENILIGNIQYRRFGEFNVSLLFDWASEYNITQCDITLKGVPPGAQIPAFYNNISFYNSANDFYNEGFTFADKVSRQNFSPSGRSEAFFMTFYTETIVQFQIDHIALFE